MRLRETIMHIVHEHVQKLLLRIRMFVFRHDLQKTVRLSDKSSSIDNRFCMDSDFLVIRLLNTPNGRSLSGSLLIFLKDDNQYNSYSNIFNV